MKLIETTVIKVRGSTATYVADHPSLGEARAEARKVGGEVLPSDVWHSGVGWFEWSRSRRAHAAKPHRRV